MLLICKLPLHGALSREMEVCTVQTVRRRLKTVDLCLCVYVLHTIAPFPAGKEKNESSQYLLKLLDRVHNIIITKLKNEHI
jgi:hypothetical protein